MLAPLLRGEDCLLFELRILDNVSETKSSVIEWDHLHGTSFVADHALYPELCETELIDASGVLYVHSTLVCAHLPQIGLFSSYWYI